MLNVLRVQSAASVRNDLRILLAELLLQHRGPDGYLWHGILPPCRPIRLEIEFRRAPASGWNLARMYSTANQRPGTFSTRIKLDRSSISDSVMNWPSGEMPKVSVCLSESNPATARRVAKVFLPGTKSCT